MHVVAPRLEIDSVSAIVAVLVHGHRAWDSAAGCGVAPPRAHPLEAFLHPRLLCSPLALDAGGLNPLLTPFGLALAFDTALTCFAMALVYLFATLRLATALTFDAALTLLGRTLTPYVLGTALNLATSFFVFGT